MEFILTDNLRDPAADSGDIWRDISRSTNRHLTYLLPYSFSFYSFFRLSSYVAVVLSKFRNDVFCYFDTISYRV